VWVSSRAVAFNRRNWSTRFSVSSCRGSYPRNGLLFIQKPRSVSGSDLEVSPHIARSKTRWLAWHTLLKENTTILATVSSFIWFCFLGLIAHSIWFSSLRRCRSSRSRWRTQGSRRRRRSCFSPTRIAQSKIKHSQSPQVYRYSSNRWRCSKIRWRAFRLGSARIKGDVLFRPYSAVYVLTSSLKAIDMSLTQDSNRGIGTSSPWSRFASQPREGKPCQRVEF